MVFLYICHKHLHLLFPLQNYCFFLDYAREEAIFYKISYRVFRLEYVMGFGEYRERIDT